MNHQQNELAPIVLFTYNRPDHTRQVLEHLAKNELASMSELYIFCDGPKNERAVEKNNATREVINKEQSLGRFKKVHVRISEENRGLANSIISGVTEVIGKYKRCIVLEDDLITSSYFLNFMNDALNYYEQDKQIWSVTGFSFALKSLQSYPFDVYLSYRANSHSWGTWLDRWETVDWEVKDFASLKYSLKKRKHFNRGGNDLYRMLRHQMRGERDSWAIRFCYSQSKQNKYTVYPKISLIKNIGFDGSGTHCQSDDAIDYSNFRDEVQNIRMNTVELDRKVTREFKSMYRVTFSEAIKWGVRKAKRILRRK